MSTDFRDGLARVRVPATSANLGPGYDSFGLALGRYDNVEAAVTRAGVVRVQVTGEGAQRVRRDASHLIAKTMSAAFARMNVEPSGFDLSCTNRIPHGRGLGSSSAAIVSGLVLARALVVDGDQIFDDEALVGMASELEGHPDNVAPCFYGGFTIAWSPSGGPAKDRAVRLEPHPDLAAVVFVPATSLSTRKARGMLPEAVPHSDASFNVSRAGLLVAAVTQRPDLLFDATEDRLHQSYRESAYPASMTLVRTLRDTHGVAAMISGAGPTVVVLTTIDRATEVAALGGQHGVGEVLRVDSDGATLLAG